MTAIEGVIRAINWRELRIQMKFLERNEDEFDEAGGLACLVEAIQQAALADGIATYEQIFGSKS